MNSQTSHVSHRVVSKVSFHQLSPYVELLLSGDTKRSYLSIIGLVSPEDTTDLVRGGASPGPWAASSQGVMLVVGSARKQRSQWCSLSYLSGSLWLLGKEELEDLICLERSAEKQFQLLLPKAQKIKSFE